MKNTNHQSSPPPPPPLPPPSPPPSSPTINHKEENEVTGFHRLPDELLLLIFTKLSNAKSLCMCNVVCKRFSVIVLQTPSISLILPHQNVDSSLSHRNENFPMKMLSYISKPLFRYIKKPPPEQFNGDLFRSAIESLKNFKVVRTLRIELPLLQQEESIIKWHAEFGKNSNLCIILFATTFRQFKITGKTPNLEIPLTNRLLQSRIALANQCFREATWRRHILRHVVEDHRETLETAEIVDSRQKGRLIMKGKQLADLLDPEVKMPTSGHGKLWHVQALQLPLSQCEMYGVSVLAIRCTNAHEERYDDDDVGLKHLVKERLERERSKGDKDRVIWEVLSHVLDDGAPSRRLNVNAGT